MNRIEKYFNKVAGAERMVNIEQLLNFDTCDITSFFLSLAEGEMDNDTLAKFRSTSSTGGL